MYSFIQNVRLATVVSIVTLTLTIVPTVSFAADGGTTDVATEIAALKAQVAELQAKLAALTTTASITHIDYTILPNPVFALRLFGGGSVEVTGQLTSKALTSSTACGIVTRGTVAWGDGTTDTIYGVGCAATTTPFTLSHRYAATGAYTITITDDSGRVKTKVVDPIVSYQPANTTLALTSVGLSATASGDLVIDQHLSSNCSPQTVATIDWGDGVKSPVTVACAAAAHTYSLAHMYSKLGVYLVSITDLDNDIVKESVVVWGVGL